MSTIVISISISTQMLLGPKVAADHCTMPQVLAVGSVDSNKLVGANKKTTLLSIWTEEQCPPCGAQDHSSWA